MKLGLGALALGLVAACTAPALFTFQPPVIMHPATPPAPGVDAGLEVLDGDIDATTPPERVYEPAIVCARLAALTCQEGLTPACGWQTAPNVDGGCVLSATTVAEVRRCRGVACP